MSESISERIKKLLRLAKSANRHEAELALQRAFEIAERHRIDVGSLDLDEESQRLVDQWFPIGYRLDLLQKRTLCLVMDYFHVDVCLANPRVVFVGRSTDIDIAHYVFEFLVRAGRRLLKDWLALEILNRRIATPTKKKNFQLGFIYGVASKLKETRQQSTAELGDSRTTLILAEASARKRHMESVVGRTEQKKIETGRRNETALMAGYRGGRETQINQSLRPGGDTLLLG